MICMRQHQQLALPSKMHVHKFHVSLFFMQIPLWKKRRRIRGKNSIISISICASDFPRDPRFSFSFSFHFNFSLLSLTPWKAHCWNSHMIKFDLIFHTHMHTLKKNKVKLHMRWSLCYLYNRLKEMKERERHHHCITRSRCNTIYMAWIVIIV